MKHLIILLLMFSTRCLSQTVEDTLVTGLENACIEEIEKNIAPASVVISASRAIPPTANLTMYLSNIGEQGKNQGSCTAFSVAAAITIKLNQQKSRTFANPNCNYYDEFISPAFIFNIAKAKYPPPRNQFCKVGITYIDAFLVLRDIGAVSWQDFNYQYTSTTSCYMTYPSNKILAKASKNKLLIFQRADIDETIFKYLLSERQGYPICIAVNIDKNYSDAGYLKSNNSTWLKKGNSIVGQVNTKHAMLVVGYDDTRRVFKVLDSRGCSWGDNGFIWLSYDALKAVVYDAYVCSFDDKLLGEEKIQQTGESEVTLDSNEAAAPYDTWLEAGYFRMFNGIRVVCLKMDKETGFAEFQIKDNITGRIITNNVQTNLNESKTFTYNSNTFTIRPYKIGKRNMFSGQTVFFTISINGKDIIEEFKKGGDEEGGKL